MTASDAVDGSSTGTEVPWMWVLFRAPTIRRSHTPRARWAVIRYAKIHGTQHRPWLSALLARRPTEVAAIALANKIARVAWAMMARGDRYKEPSHLRRERDRADIRRDVKVGRANST
jgi:hypothetical protein